MRPLTESTPPCGVPLLTYLLIFESPRVELTILPVSSELVNSINCVLIFSLDSADVIAVGITLLKAPSIARKAHNANSVVRTFRSGILESEELSLWIGLYSRHVRFRYHMII